MLGVALLVLGLSPARGAAPAGDIAEYGRPALRVFTDRDGLPQNSIENILTDANGYLWIATQDGMARYNGRTWTQVQLPTAKDSQWVRGAAATRDGSLWFGRQLGGICRLKDGQWTTFGEAQGLPKGPVMDFAETRDGSLLAATGNGIFRLRDGAWTALAAQEANLRGQVNCLCLTRDAAGRDVVWAGTEHGLGRYQGGAWTWAGHKEGLPADPVSALCQPAADRGTARIWAGTSLGVARFDGKAWQAYGEGEGLPRNLVSRIVEGQDAQGQPLLWIGTGQGLIRWQAGRARTFDFKAGFPNQMIRSILATTSPEGIRTVWAGTFGGLVRMTSGMWTSLDTRASITDNVCFHIEEDRATGSWLLSTLGGGLARFHNGVWEDFGRTGFSSRQVFGTLITRAPSGSQVLWVGTQGDGLMRWEGGKWTHLGEAQGFKDPWSYSLYETHEADGRSVLWAGSRSGIARLDRGAWTHFGVEEGVPKAPVMGFADAGQGGTHQVWAASRGGGVLRLDGSHWVASTQADGLPSNWVMDLKVRTPRSGARQLWAATFGGLAWRDLATPEAHWQILERKGLPALPTDTFYQIQFDAQDRVYAFSLRGVARLEPAPGGAWNVKVFTTGDGLPSNGCTQGSTLVDAKGRIWTGTVGGAAMFDPADEVQDRTPKPLVLEQVLVGGQEHPASRPLELTWKGAEVEFRYALLSYYREEDTRFRTQLVGLEKAPSAWGSDLKRTYPTLPGGSYTFRVWARDYAGNETGPVERSFKVAIAPWRTWWAALVYLGALGAGLRLFLRRRMQVLNQRNEELEARVKARTLDLEVMDGIVQSLNRQTDLKGLFRDLLDKGQLLFPQADRIVLLVRSEDGSRFRAEAASSTLEGEAAALNDFELTAQAAMERYTLQGHQLEEGVFLVRDVQALPVQERQLALPAPGAMLAMTLGAGQDVDGFLVLDHMRSREGFDHSDEVRLARFREHAVSALAKARTLAKLEEANQALKETSMVDPMTGLKNRRFLDLSMPEELARVNRQWRRPGPLDRSRVAANVDLLFYMVDLDHFKLVNDTYGHAAGDAVLCQASAALRGACRESDIVVRWGGEEFLIMARNADRQFAEVLAQNLLAAVGNKVFDLGHGVTIRKTCSIGFTAYPVLADRPEDVSWEEAVDLADRCLYAAKLSGRNGWVGVRVSRLPDEPGRGHFHDLPARQSQGDVEVLSSFPPGTALEWPRD